MTGADGDELVLRANPRYELVAFDRLSEGDKEALAGLLADPDFYGVLRDPAGALPLKALNREAALLFQTLRQPGPAPPNLDRALGAEAGRFLTRCVLDGVLEAQTGGAWTSGPGALGEAPARGSAGTNADLSRRALGYGATLTLDAVTLSARLYFYNRLPATRRWRALLPDERATAAYLGLEEVLERSSGWREVVAPADNTGWHFFAPSAPRPARTRTIYKLYVSPLPYDLPEVLSLALGVFGGLATSAKVGRDLAGILRPDKLVAYFDEWSMLEEAAGRMCAATRGLAAHGVPFTARWGDEGLVSWGVDPPAGERVVAWQGPSWRRWVTDRLASALASAARGGHSDRVSFAVERVALDGVDPDTWAPLPEVVA